MEKQTQRSCKTCLDTYLPFLLILLGLLFLYNAFTVWETGQAVSDAIAEVEEAAIPLTIEMTLISAANCDDCFTTTSVIDAVEALNVNITKQNELQSDSDEARAFINEYSIQKLPAIILVGALSEKEAVATQLETLFEKVSDKTLIFQAPTPPYLNTTSNEVVGRVTVLSLSAPQCEECQDIASMIPGLEKVLSITDVKEIVYETAEADALIARYNLTVVPTIIISADAAAYEGFSEAWKSYGTQEEDGSFVLRQSVPPYLNVTTGGILGLVDIIYLVDESCDDCYDVSIHNQVLQGFGIVFGEEETIDISSEDGQALLELYSITKVPTVILSSDAGVYPALKQAWSQVGEIADDDSYVFTNMEQLQDVVYTDLEEK